MKSWLDKDSAQIFYGNRAELEDSIKKRGEYEYIVSAGL